MKNPSLRALIAAAIFGICTLLATLPAHANGLKQVNPVKQAPSTINAFGSDATMDENEYPWFSSDGKLFFWTRQENPNPGTQWIWVSYLKNRDAVVATGENQTLPNLQVAIPVDLHDVNHHFIVNNPGSEIKAFAVCEESDSGYDYDLVNRWRYRFTLYLAVGPPGALRKMYRAHRVFVVVDKATEEIIDTGISGGITEVIPTTYHPLTGDEANETEPFVSPDNKKLFWASNVWYEPGVMAKYIESSTTCGMTTSTPKDYSTLPSGTYAWKDQYDSGFSYQRTSTTNYHSILQRSDGKTALLFEQCEGQYDCNTSQTGNRQCECDQDRDWLATTGFTSGDTPSTIVNGPSGVLNPTNIRVSHPAVSGPQNADGSWLLFFMRGKKIWYTKIKETP